MAKPILDDDLWTFVEPMLPRPKPRRFRHPGRKPITHRQALTGILFVLRTGITWDLLPQEMGCGSGVSCWRRLRDWERAGVCHAIHTMLLAELRRHDELDLSIVTADSCSVRAVGAGENGTEPHGSPQAGDQASSLDRRRGCAALEALRLQSTNTLIPLGFSSARKLSLQVVSERPPRLFLERRARPRI